MPRGGYRTGAGGKPTWKYGQTKPVRVPIALSERVLELARLLDEGNELGVLDNGFPQAESKILNLSGVAILSSQRGPVVRLADLVKAGYQIQPERLMKSIKPEIDRELKLQGDLDSFLEEFL